MKFRPEVLDTLLFLEYYFGLDKYEGLTEDELDLFQAETILEVLKYQYGRDRGRFPIPEFKNFTASQLAHDARKRYDEKYRNKKHRTKEEAEVWARKIKEEVDHGVCAAFSELVNHWWIPDRILRSAVDESHMSRASLLMAIVHSCIDTVKTRSIERQCPARILKETYESYRFAPSSQANRL